MNKYLQFYRLYYVWFTVASLVCLWLFYAAPSVSIVLIIRAACYPAIFILIKPFVKRYFCYFQNLGFSARRLFIRIAITDFTVFIIVILIINLFRNA